VADIIDVHLVVERLRDNAPTPPDTRLGDVAISPESLVPTRSPARTH
jgi:hypothetical protein